VRSAFLLPNRHQSLASYVALERLELPTPFNLVDGLLYSLNDTVCLLWGSLSLPLLRRKQYLDFLAFLHELAQLLHLHVQVISANSPVQLDLLGLAVALDLFDGGGL